MKKPDLQLRQRELELMRVINRSVALEADTIRQLLLMRLEAVKEKLVTAVGDDMLRLQGEAQCLRHMHNDFTRPLRDDPQE